ncbi:hypothetical protein GCM10023403_60880 [Pseudonocardia benzenivorans]
MRPVQRLVRHGGADDRLTPARGSRSGTGHGTDRGPSADVGPAGSTPGQVLPRRRPTGVPLRLVTLLTDADAGPTDRLRERACTLTGRLP